MKWRQVFVGALVVGVGLVYGASAQAQSSFSGSVKLTTDYAFQGASDSDGAPALQGSFDWSHIAGLYTGVWGSNAASSAGDGTNNVSGVELNYYGGYSRKLTDQIGFDIRITYLHYVDGDSNTDTWESYVKPQVTLSYNAGLASFGVTYARGLKDTPENRYILNASLPLSQHLPLGQYKDIPVALRGEFGINDYTDNYNADDYNWYLGGIGTKIKGFGLEFFYTGRTYVDSDTDDPDPIVGGSISRSF